MPEKLAELFYCMWRKEANPQEFKDAPIRKSISLWQRHLTLKHCLEETGKNSVEPSECSSLSECTYPRKSIWIQKRQRDNRHALHSKTASGEMPRTECRSIHDICRTHKSF